MALQQASDHHVPSLSPLFQSPIPAVSASSSIRIELNVVLELRKLNYKWTKIASLLGVSRATLYQWLGEAGFTSSSSITEQQLDKTIQSSKQDHPNDGEVLI